MVEGTIRPVYKVVITAINLKKFKTDLPLWRGTGDEGDEGRDFTLSIFESFNF